MPRPLIRPLFRPLVRGVTEPGYGSLAAQIRLLFAAGEQGAWYDPSDLSSMNTKHDGSGTVPGVGDPVGYIADKSGRGNHAKQTTDTARPTLQLASGRYYLQFDGVDDFLVTAAIDFTGTDKMTVVTGVRKESDAAIGTLLELSSTSTGNSGTFAIFAPNTNNLPSTNFSWRVRDTVLREATANSAAPVTRVVTGIGASGSGAQIRLDGVLADTGPVVGMANYENYPLYVGRRGGTTFPFKGNLYSLLIRGAASTAAQIAAAERYAAAKTGVTLA